MLGCIHICITCLLNCCALGMSDFNKEIWSDLQYEHSLVIRVLYVDFVGKHFFLVIARNCQSMFPNRHSSSILYIASTLTLVGAKWNSFALSSSKSPLGESAPGSDSGGNSFQAISQWIAGAPGRKCPGIWSGDGVSISWLQHVFSTKLWFQLGKAENSLCWGYPIDGLTHWCVCCWTSVKEMILKDVWTSPRIVFFVDLEGLVSRPHIRLGLWGAVSGASRRVAWFVRTNRVTAWESGNVAVYVLVS